MKKCSGCPSSSAVLTSARRRRRRRRPCLVPSARPSRRRSAVAAISVAPAVVAAAVSAIAPAAGPAPSPPAAAAVTSASAAVAHAAAPPAAPLVHLHVRPIAGVGAPLKHNHRVDTTPNVGADMRGAGIQGSSLKKSLRKVCMGSWGPTPNLHPLPDEDRPFLPLLLRKTVSQRR